MNKFKLILFILLFRNLSLAGTGLQNLFPESKNWVDCINDWTHYLEISYPNRNGRVVLDQDAEFIFSNSPVDGRVYFSHMLLLVIDNPTQFLGITGCGGSYSSKYSTIFASNNKMKTNRLDNDTKACGSDIDYKKGNVSEFIPIDGTELFLTYSSKYNNIIDINNSLNIDYNFKNQPIINLNFYITPTNSKSIYTPILFLGQQLQNVQFLNSSKLGLIQSNAYKDVYSFKLEVKKSDISIETCAVRQSGEPICTMASAQDLFPIFFDSTTMVHYKPEVFGLKGWTVSNHHYFDRDTKTMFLGSGEIVNYSSFITQTDASYGTIDLVISKQNPNEIFIFDINGRHLETKNALFNKTVYKFNYFENNYLKSIDNQFGQSIIFQYDGSGNIGKIIAFNGVESIISSSSTKMNSFTDSLNQNYEMTYDDRSLLKTFKSINGVLTTFTYGVDGSFQKEEKNNGLLQYFTSTIINSLRKYTHFLRSGEKNNVQIEMVSEGVTTYKYNDQNQLIYKKENFSLENKEIISTESGMIQTNFTRDPVWGDDFYSSNLNNIQLNEANQNVSLIAQSLENRSYQDSSNPLTLKSVNYFYSKDSQGSFANAQLIIGEEPILMTRNYQGQDNTTYFYPNGLVKRIKPFNQFPTEFTYDNFGRLNYQKDHSFRLLVMISLDI